MSHSALLGIAAALLGVACSQSQVPAGKLANTRSAISAAEESGADKTPRSALHLKMAEDQLYKAERLMNEGENEDAALYLNQAQADADLALALARTNQAREDARQAAARVENLRKEAE